MSDFYGWQPDPFGLHELRYLSQGSPTKLVRDGGVEGYDEPPSEEVQSPRAPELLSQAIAPPVGGQQWPPALTRGSVVPPIPVAKAGHSRARVVAVLAPLVLVVGLVIAAVLVFGGSSSHDAGAAAAFVQSASQTTLAQSTADIVISGNVSVGGDDVPITGSGAAVLTDAQQFAATVSFTASGVSFQEKEVLTDGHFYMGIESGGQDISSILPGKHWVEIPVPVGGGGSSGTGTSDPIAQLQLLAANGNQVAALGTKVIDGETDSGYAVTITRQNVLNGIQKFNVSSGLDAAAQKQLSQAAQNTPIPTIDVWFDSSKLLRRMSVAMNQVENGQAVSVNLDMDFESYGTPVSISAPLADYVATYNQFLAAEGTSSASEG
jgi:hypothetical protein